MQIHQLKRPKQKSKKRVGRGGKRGTFSGRGVKGQKSRAGKRIRPAIRDLIQKIPKLRGVPASRYKKQGVKQFKTIYQIVNLDILEKKFKEGEVVSPRSLLEKKLVRRIKGKTPPVKVLGRGELTKKLEFVLNVKKAADKYDVSLFETEIDKFASLDSKEFNPNFADLMNIRLSYLADDEEELQTSYKDLYDRSSELGPIKTAKVLFELDKIAEMHVKYGHGVEDPLLATLSIRKYAHRTIDNKVITQNQLIEADTEKLRWAMTVGCLIDPKSPAFNYDKNRITKRPILGSGVIIEETPALIPMILTKSGRWNKRLPKIKL